MKLNNSYLRKLNKEHVAFEKDIIAENLKKAGDTKAIFTGIKDDDKEIFRLSLLNRMNIRKSLPIFLNI